MDLLFMKHFSIETLFHRIIFRRTEDMKIMESNQRQPDPIQAQMIHGDDEKENAVIGYPEIQWALSLKQYFQE